MSGRARIGVPSLICWLALLPAFQGGAAETAPAAPKQRSAESALCAGRPLHAQFIAKIVETKQAERRDREKGWLCRFRIQLQSWKAGEDCPFEDRARVNGSWVEMYDNKKGCPVIPAKSDKTDPGYSFSGVVELDRDNQIDWDASWHNEKPNHQEQ